MKCVVSLFTRLILVVCLTAYGQFGPAHAQSSGALFAVEICASGTAKTVLIDAEGQPATPAHSCYKCLTCCQATDGHVPASHRIALVLTLNGVLARSGAAQTQTPKARNIRPMLRGPPAMSSITQLSDLGTAVLRPIHHSDGQPVFKDATA